MIESTKVKIKKRSDNDSGFTGRVEVQQASAAMGVSVGVSGVNEAEVQARRQLLKCSGGVFNTKQEASWCVAMGSISGSRSIANISSMGTFAPTELQKRVTVKCEIKDEERAETAVGVTRPAAHDEAALVHIKGELPSPRLQRPGCCLLACSFCNEAGTVRRSAPAPCTRPVSAGEEERACPSCIDEATARFDRKRQRQRQRQERLMSNVGDEVRWDMSSADSRQTSAVQHQSAAAAWPLAAPAGAAVGAAAAQAQQQPPHLQCAVGW
jgi:hypothetical protein